jgi:hypothetical protein
MNPQVVDNQSEIVSDTLFPKKNEHHVGVVVAGGP